MKFTPAQQGTPEPPRDFAPPSLLQQYSRFLQKWKVKPDGSGAQFTTKNALTTSACNRRGLQSQIVIGDHPLPSSTHLGMLFLLLVGSSGPKGLDCSTASLVGSTRGKWRSD